MPRRKHPKIRTVFGFLELAKALGISDPDRIVLLAELLSDEELLAVLKDVKVFFPENIRK